MFEGIGVTKIILAAARVKQGDLVLFATSIKVRDLVTPGFYSVETLDPDDKSDKGFQRLLNTARAKRLADYIIKGQDSKDAFLPTSVFLATHKSIPFNEGNNTIEIDTSTTCPFSVVDGQHRLEGLKMAAQKDPRVLDFETPVNIAVNLPLIAQMCHFLIVNTTQKSVDKSVEQRIIARLSEALDVEDIPSLPKWILNTVEKGEVDKALKYVVYLNQAEDSPWKGKILMANSEADDTTINQRSFVKAIVKYVLTANNPIAIINDFEKEKKIFLNYWKPLRSCWMMATPPFCTNTMASSCFANSQSRFLQDFRTKETSRFPQWRSCWKIALKMFKASMRVSVIPIGGQRVATRAS